MPTKEAELEDLLKSLFPLSGELHRFIRGLEGGREVVEALSAANTPLADVAHYAVIALQARGMICASFFINLLRARRKRMKDIAFVLEGWGLEIVLDADEDEVTQLMELIPEEYRFTRALSEK